MLNERSGLTAAYLVALISSKCILQGRHAKNSFQLFYQFACTTKLAQDPCCLLQPQTSSEELMLAA
jgi:hypothetical protein